jgi:hypothetical protein
MRERQPRYGDACGRWYKSVGVVRRSLPIHAVAVRNDVYEPNPDGKYSTASGGWSEMGSNDRRIIVIAREGRTGDRAEGLWTDD